MEQIFISDPFVWIALGVYLAVVVFGTVLRGAWGLARRRGTWGALEHALESLGPARDALGWAPLAGGRFLVYARGGQAAVVDPSSDSPPKLRKVTRIALVKDQDQQTGLVVTVDGADHCVSGLAEMARLWSIVQQDDVPVRIVFREDEGATMTRKLADMAEGQRNLILQWLTEDEIVTDIISGVSYEGSTGTEGEPAYANLIVTNLRVGLLAATKTVQREGNQVRTTTHLALLSYLLPIAESVTFERGAGLESDVYTVQLKLPAEHERADAPTLKLGPAHAGMLLPLVMYGRPVQVRDPHPSGWVGDAIFAGIGWGLLWALLAFGVSFTLWNWGLAGDRSWWYRYVIPMVVAGAATPLFMRGSRLVVASAERARAARLTPAPA